MVDCGRFWIICWRVGLSWSQDSALFFFCLFTTPAGLMNFPSLLDGTNEHTPAHPCNSLLPLPFTIALPTWSTVHGAVMSVLLFYCNFDLTFLYTARLRSTVVMVMKYNARRPTSYKRVIQQPSRSWMATGTGSSECCTHNSWSTGQSLVP